MGWSFLLKRAVRFLRFWVNLVFWGFANPEGLALREVLALNFALTAAVGLDFLAATLARSPLAIGPEMLFDPCLGMRPLSNLLVPFRVDQRKAEDFSHNFEFLSVLYLCAHP